jgi:hypothetical protein
LVTARKEAFELGCCRRKCPGPLLDDESSAALALEKGKYMTSPPISIGQTGVRAWRRNLISFSMRREKTYAVLAARFILDIAYTPVLSINRVACRFGRYKTLAALTLRLTRAK